MGSFFLPLLEIPTYGRFVSVETYIDVLSDVYRHTGKLGNAAILGIQFGKGKFGCPWISDYVAWNLIF